MAVRNCQHHNNRVNVVEHLADSLEGRVDQKVRQEIVSLISDNAQAQRAKTKLKI